MAVIIMGTARITASAAPYPTVKAEIPVSQMFTNNGEANADGTFTYQIKTEDKDNPMPEGIAGDIFSINGNEEILLKIIFDRVGIYKYEIKQITTEEKTGYTYDSRSYFVTVHVKNGDNDSLKTDIFLQNQSGEKIEKIEFNTSYQNTTTETVTTENETTEEETTEDKTTEDKTTEDKTTEADKPKGNGTETGDRVIWPYYLCLICGTTLFGVCIRIKRLQK